MSEIRDVTVTLYEVEGKKFGTLEEAKDYVAALEKTSLVDKFVAEKLVGFKPRTLKRMRETLLDWEDYKAGTSPE